MSVNCVNKNVPSHMATSTAENTTHVFEIYLKISLKRLRIVCTLCGNKMATKIASKTIKVDIK